MNALILAAALIGCDAYDVQQVVVNDYAPVERVVVQKVRVRRQPVQKVLRVVTAPVRRLRVQKVRVERVQAGCY